MVTADEKTRICDEIEAMFENLSIEDVAEILTIQMASMIAQGSTSQADAQDFLDDVRQDIASYLQNVDFDAMIGDETEMSGEQPQQTQD